MTPRRRGTPAPTRRVESTTLKSSPPITGGPARMVEPAKASLFLDYRHICAYDGPKRGCPRCQGTLKEDNGG